MFLFLEILRVCVAKGPVECDGKFCNFLENNFGSAVVSTKIWYHLCL